MAIASLLTNASARKQLEERAKHCAAYAGLLQSETFFRTDQPIVSGRAPGRLDVMGGIGDYSGSRVLELPAREGATIAIQNADDGIAIVSRISYGQDDEHHGFCLNGAQWNELRCCDYDSARRQIAKCTGGDWAAYVIGVVLVISRELGLDAPGGFRAYLESTVPIGKGLSSSAAIEVATGRTFAELSGQSIAGDELARLCQLAENQVVGAPCGIMDQMTSAMGREGELLSLVCQPAIVEQGVPIPDSIGFWGIDSGIRHAVSGNDYGSVRTGSFMGYRIIAALAGLKVAPGNSPGKVQIEDHRWHGYLANVGTDEFERNFASKLPERMIGRDFLQRYGGITDPVTSVDVDREYAVLCPTAHPVFEHERVTEFRNLLPRADDEEVRRELGRLMIAAHDSYSDCGLGSDGTDLIVELARKAGPERGIYGAKITGGGSGGTVAILGGAGAGPVIDEITQQYSAMTKRPSAVYHGSSNGACHTPCLRY
jgi:L-arabinokinase